MGAVLDANRERGVQEPFRANVVHSSVLHTFLLAPPCLLHVPCVQPSNWHVPTTTMLATGSACLNKRGAAFHLAHFLAHFFAATTMLAAPSFRYRSGGVGAIAEGAGPIGAVFDAEPTSASS